MQRNLNKIFLTCMLAMLPALGFADLSVSSDGGVMIGKQGDPYWFQLGGAIKLDQRSFFGQTKGAATPYFAYSSKSDRTKVPGSYMSGAFIRDMSLDIGGGVGEDFTYSGSLDFDAHANEAKVDFIYLTYHGFRDLMPNFNFSIGQVYPGFCISCAASGKWIPFMERSMATNTFGPKQGMGVSANTYNDHYSTTVAITQQPRMGSSAKSLDGQNIKHRDLWQASGRFTYAPISETGRVLQFGFSAHIQEYSNTGLEFKANPEMKTNNSTTLLNTSYGTSAGTVLISAKNQKTVDFEITGVHGPWSGEVEYQRAYVSRGYTTPGVKQGPNLTFSGYHGQISYILTGETRPLRKFNGTLGQIKPLSKKGAWEISARYSVINLNNKDIFGGKARNTTGSISWYANNNVRVIGEYVYSKQRRQFSNYLDKRSVSSIGARLQVVF